MSEFKEKVIQAVTAVPYGNVASYGQIALMVGVPRGARQVGWILNGLESEQFAQAPNLPWWRIVNNQGRISIKGTKYNDANLQKQNLEAEGINIKSDLTFDIEKYRFRPAITLLMELKLDEDSISMVLSKYLPL